MDFPSARLARAYDQALAAVSDEGEATPAALRFVAWLAEHWSSTIVEPAWSADAVSVDRNGILTIRWYTIGHSVVGCPISACGCYVVSAEEALLLA